MPRKTVEVNENTKDNSIEVYRNNAIKVAKELHYGKNIVKHLFEAKSQSEICRIMNTARNNY